MSGESSSADAWFTHLEPAATPTDLPQRADDPRLGNIFEFWRGDGHPLRAGRIVLLGFPQDEGVRRNLGRPGAAEAPREIRHWLYRLTPWDGASGIDLADLKPLDLGDIRITGSLEQSQQALGTVVAAILQAGAIPIVLGGGHETAYGHYLGYVAAERPVGILNLDAHLDVRPCIEGLGHSGSSFRQALEHPTHPLPDNHYVCLGAQRHSVSWQHWLYTQLRGGVVCWSSQLRRSLIGVFQRQLERLARSDCHVYVTLDADVVRVADMPGVSAPNALGLPGDRLIWCAYLAGTSPHVSSFDLVEINPRYDRDGQSARWAALAIWHFCVGVANRGRKPRRLPRA